MRAIAAALSLPCVRVCIAISAGIGLLLLAIPLFAVQGVESALALGIGLPPMAGLVGARLALRARRVGSGNALALAAEAGAAAGLLLVVPALILAINALRVPNCAP